MRVHILFTIQDEPSGGGNQFLKALREELRRLGTYAETEREADVFIFNSFQDIGKVLVTKLKYPHRPFIHRIDGPISVYRNSESSLVDRLTFTLNHAIADATIFQSNYSRDANKKLGMNQPAIETVIANAPDTKIFYRKKDRPISQERKVKLISTSWSANPMKGFDVYAWIDQHLDFSRYEYLFVGNSPVPFKNIKLLPPQPSAGVADLLRDSDIYLSASRKDPCSNSLLEALSCGLPALAIHDGGHPELIEKGGETFHTKEEIPEKITRILSRYETYAGHIPQRTIGETARQYLSFTENLLPLQKVQPFSIWRAVHILFLAFRYRIQETL